MLGLAGGGGCPRGVQARMSEDEKKPTQDSKESLFPAPKGVRAALISTHHLPFTAPGRRELSVNSFPALGPWALPEGTPLCLSLKGTFGTKV